MKSRIDISRMLAPALRLISVVLTVSALSGAAPPRPQGPCDIYATGGTPCVAAHSTTRALYTSYNGPLYRVKRQSDGKKLDIGMAKPVESPNTDGGGYADATAQDAFCANTICVIELIYDQSGKGNHLYQAGPGTFKGPAKGAFDTQPIADMAPVTIGGHKAYGVFIMPGMGFRNNNATDIAINDEPEGIYYVIDGKHYDSGCCFDYGNSSTNGRAVGTGTMETTYFGTATAWGSGTGPGPWIMSDMEAGLFSGYNAKQNGADPTVDSWRFVTAVVDGGGGNKWDLRGGDAQKGSLTTFYSGVRPGSPGNNNYYPMHKQGGILLGTGGDNGNGSSGTFFEGVMTTGYPTEATTNAVQANIVAAKYDVQRVSLSRVTAFTPKSSQEVTETFTNTAEAPAAGVRLSMPLPAGWTVVVSGTAGTSKTFVDPVAPGASASAVFKVTSPAATGAGFLSGKAEWKGSATSRMQFETTTTRVRNALPIKINEVRFGTTGNSTDQFIEIYNASAAAVDLSNWALIHAPGQWAPVRLATIPPGTKLARGAYYLLGLSGSGLAGPAQKGMAAVSVRSTTGFAVGQQIGIDGETRTVKSVRTPAATLTTVFVPVSTGPWITIPAGSTNLSVTSAVGFVVGEKIGIDAGGNYEVSTVKAVGHAATQTTLSGAAVAGATNLKVAADSNIAVGDTLTVGTGGRRELVKVTSVGTPGASGTGITLAAPLRFDNMQGVDVSDPGTGISFAPATRFPHVSGDAVQALGTGVVLDSPLSNDHAYGAAVVNARVTEDGYQGSPSPNQWFGGALSTTAGSISLVDASGALVDAMVYGSQQSSSSGNGTIASPEIATLKGDQNRGGCIAVVPAPTGGAGRSRGLFPDGHDTDSNCTDFQLQAATTLSAASAAGANNIKVASVADFRAGQTIVIDPGTNAESAVIATVGTAGATTSGAATVAGSTAIPVAGTAGFSSGQTISIDSGANRETAVIAFASGGRGRSGRGGARGAGATIAVAEPLKFAHAAGVQVSGSGITVSSALTGAHSSGAQVAASIPTPGAPNKY